MNEKSSRIQENSLTHQTNNCHEQFVYKLQEEVTIKVSSFKSSGKKPLPPHYSSIFDQLIRSFKFRSNTHMTDNVYAMNCEMAQANESIRQNVVRTGL